MILVDIYQFILEIFESSINLVFINLYLFLSILKNNKNTTTYYKSSNIRLIEILIFFFSYNQLYIKIIFVYIIFFFYIY